MAEVTENSTISHQTRLKLRRPKDQPILNRDPNPQIPSIVQSTRCTSTISSLLLSTFSTTTDNIKADAKCNKKKSFKSATLRGLGCASPSPVTVPEVIRSSADWEENIVRKKKKKKKHQKKKKNNNQLMGNNSSMAIVVPDVCCGPEIGFVVDAAPSIDFVERRVISGRGKLDTDKLNQGEEHFSCPARRTANHQPVSGLDSDSIFDIMQSESDVFEARYYRHIRHCSPEGLSEIMMFQRSLIGQRSNGRDRYREWRLDVDNMTYEELLELGDKIGYVNTGLREDEIVHCLRKSKLSNSDDLSTHIPAIMEWKCSICQEEYGDDDEMGKLECGHNYHIECIKQWLVQKNSCPVCKAVAAASQN